MKVGYARVSTGDQTTELQLQALSAAGVEKVFQEHASGASVDRVELARCLEHLRRGDVLVVWKLDRLGRSLSHLVTVTEDLKTRGIGFVSLTESIDTGTVHGRLLFGLFGVLAEFERALIQERIRAGIAAARANGKHGGRPPSLNAAQLRQLGRMAAEDTPQAEMARALRVSRWTIRRALLAAGYDTSQPRLSEQSHLLAVVPSTLGASPEG